jgi:hypothetical protein
MESGLWACSLRAGPPRDVVSAAKRHPRELYDVAVVPSSPGALGVVRNLPAGLAGRAVHQPVVPRPAIAERAMDAHRVVEEAHEVDPRDESGLVAAAKRLRMELLSAKAELERELGNVLLHCRGCNRRVHWVPGVGPEPGHWAHAEPSPQGHDPVV